MFPANLARMRGENSFVMPGLDPGIHPSSQKNLPKKMDHRVKPGDDIFNNRLAFWLFEIRICNSLGRCVS
jgi:hypothetical protein